jgi:hypothetical protein
MSSCVGHSFAIRAKLREIRVHRGTPARVAPICRSCEQLFLKLLASITLGEVAWRHPQRLHLENQELGGSRSTHKIVQFWSHASPDEPQSRTQDQPFECAPESHSKACSMDISIKEHVKLGSTMVTNGDQLKKSSPTVRTG